jgi:MFS transporter, SHS family, lactate transporter
MACVYVYVIILTFLGPEYLGRDFHVENDEDMAIAAGRTNQTNSFNGVGHDSSDDGHGSGYKESAEVKEKI